MHLCRGGNKGVLFGLELSEVEDQVCRDVPVLMKSARASQSRKTERTLLLLVTKEKFTHRFPLWHEAAVLSVI